MWSYVMKLHVFSKGIVEVHVDLDTATLVQLVSTITGSKHLFSRRPELVLKVPSMGIVEIEPEFCSDWKVISLTNDHFIAECVKASYRLVKSIKLYEGYVEYEYRVVNSDVKSLNVRPRVAVYIACARGGFWGDEGVEGAINTCHYYVNYGYNESWGTFSTTRTPGTPRGYIFEKHSYREKWFPEVKWIAFIDKKKEEGLLVQCLSEGCYAAVEDQFFNIEVNLSIPAKTLIPGEEVVLKFRLIPITGLTRVDYCDDDVVIGIEGPSLVTPSSIYTGTLQIYPLRDMVVNVNGKIIFVRGMQSIGKRGYCVDRVISSERSITLKFTQQSFTSGKFKPTKIAFNSSQSLRWGFERELYEIPYLEVILNNKVVRRAISINPDVEDALLYCPRELLKIVEKHIYLNSLIESEYLEREASRVIYDLVLSMRLNPRKILKLRTPVSKYLEELVLNYLNSTNINYYIEMWQKRILDPTIVSKTPILQLALAYFLTRSEGALRAISNLFDSFVELVLDNVFITYYSPVHGGGGADRFADFVVALDLVEHDVNESIISDTYRALRLITLEISKLANTWTGNWELSEAAALLALSYKLGYYGSDVDFYRALATAKRALNSFLPDGAWPELAASYHVASLSHLVKISEFLRYISGENLYTYTLTPGDVPVFKKALIWLWNILTPIDTTPALEDTNEFTPLPDIYALPGLALSDKELLSIALRLYKKHGIFHTPWTYLVMIHDNINILNYKYTPVLRKKITVLESSGRFIYRESESENSFYLILDFGSQGGWHGHPDRLSFEIYYYSEPLIVDAGSAGYYNPLHWTWSRRSIAHNTVTAGEIDLPEHVRGSIVNYEELKDGFKAIFQLNTDYFTVKRTMELRSDGIFKRVGVNDVIYGKGVFRWNLHCRGSIIENHGNIVVLKSPRGLEFSIIAPENTMFTLSEGYRGALEKTVYLYYERNISNIGYMGGIILLKQHYN